MLQEQTEACSNCRALIPESKHMLHELYCQRNCKKCTTCGRFQDLNDIESHEEEFHKNLNKQVPQKTQEPPKKQEVYKPQQPTTRTTQPIKKDEVVGQQFSRVKPDEQRIGKGNIQPEIKVPSSDIPQKFNNPSNIRAQVQEPQQYRNQPTQQESQQYRNQPTQQEQQYPNRNQPSKFEEDQIRTIDKAQENYKSKIPTRPNQGNVPQRENVPQRDNNSGYGQRNAQEIPLKNYRNDQDQRVQREEPKKETESLYKSDYSRRPEVNDFNPRRPQEELSRKYTEDTKKKDNNNKPNIDIKNSQPQPQSNYQNKYTAKRDIDYAGNKETKQNVGYQAKKDIQEKLAPTKNLDRPGTAFARELQAQMNIENNIRPEDLGMTAEEFALYLSNEQSFNTQKNNQTHKQPLQRPTYQPKAQQEFYDDDDQLQYAIQQSQQQK